MGGGALLLVRRLNDVLPLISVALWGRSASSGLRGLSSPSYLSSFFFSELRKGKPLSCSSNIFLKGPDSVDGLLKIQLRTGKQKFFS